MSVAPAPATRPIEFRNATLDSTIAVLRVADAPALADALHKMLGGMPDFFNGEATVLDFAELADPPQRIDWPGLLSLLKRFRLQPIGVRNLTPPLAETARQAGLALLDAAELSEPPPESARPAPAVAEADAPPTPAPAAARVEPAPAQVDTLFVDRPLRSGQQVYARGGDIVLLAGMSNGAEVIADGSIHCYGPLRGRAIAGAQGNASARIVTTNFGPEIVSIAGVYKTFEQGIAESLAGKAAHVRMVMNGTEQKLGIESLALD